MANTSRYTRLLVLGTSCALIAQGCIFSQSFLDGEGNNASDPADMGVTPSDMARMDASTDDGPAPDSDPSPDLDDAGVPDPQCGDELKCGSGMTCIAGVCEELSGCLSPNELEMICNNSDCVVLQHACLDQGFQSTECSPPPVNTPNPPVCTQAGYQFNGVTMASRVAIGSGHAVVSTGDAAFPRVFKQAQNIPSQPWAKGLQLEVTTNELETALQGWKPNDGRTLLSVTWMSQGSALDMNEDGDLIAYTASATLTFTSGTSVTTNVVHVFKRNNMMWSHDTTLFPLSVTDEYSAFGSSIALHGNKLAIGSPNAAGGLIGSSGAVYVYVRDSQKWTQPITCTQPLTRGFGQRVEFAPLETANNDVIIYGTGMDTISDKPSLFGCVNSESLTTPVIGEIGSVNASLSAIPGQLLVRSPGEAFATLYTFVVVDNNEITTRPSLKYMTSNMPDVHPVARVVRDTDQSKKRLLFSSAKQLQLAPTDHDTDPSVGAPVSDYTFYKPLGGNSSVIVDADVNASGDMIFIVAGSNKDSVFFARDEPLPVSF